MPETSSGGVRKPSITHALDTIPRFDFAGTAYSHGWYALAPNRGDPEERSLERRWKVDGGVARIRLSQPAGPGGRIDMEVLSGRGSRSGLPSLAWRAIERDARHMLRLDEDLSAFHALCRRAGPPFDRAAARGFGRLLRSPSLFEDLVKVLATTNTQWSGTKAMVAKLVELADEGGAFPGPDRVAELGAARIRDRARWGYRAVYLVALAKAIAKRKLDLARWQSWEGTTDELEAEIRALPGFGPYAAAHVLTLLGRYDRIGVDTVFREFVRRAHFPRARKAVADRRMLAVYDRWGEWKMLAYWFELWTDYVGDDSAGEGTKPESEM
jgi:3-methyladenine DNA glycosylase/8-oxoguanine DNA glycosylase